MNAKDKSWLWPWMVVAAAILLAWLFGGCQKARSSSQTTGSPTAPASKDPDQTPRRSRSYKVVHVFVALCDNDHQSIDRVPAALGNGQKPATNLYWGAQYGVKTFFSRSRQWQSRALRGFPARPYVLDRAAFCDAEGGKKLWIVAEAYDGAHMGEALTDFFAAASGTGRVEFAAGEGKGTHVQAGGWADMVAFVGHNGLMDLKAPAVPRRVRSGPLVGVVLACKSQKDFSSLLRQASCRPLVTTTGLMAPEAYVLDAIVRTWGADGDPKAIGAAAAAAYNEKQHCGLRAAQKLFMVSE